MNTLQSVEPITADWELRLAPPPGGADAVPLLRAALARCRTEGFRRFTLEPGIWNLFPERALGLFRHISNHDAGYRRVAIHLDGFSDFEIDGQCKAGMTEPRILTDLPFAGPLRLATAASVESNVSSGGSVKNQKYPQKS